MKKIVKEENLEEMVEQLVREELINYRTNKFNQNKDDSEEIPIGINLGTIDLE